MKNQLSRGWTSRQTIAIGTVGVDIIHNSKVKASEFKAVKQTVLNNEFRRREIR